MPRPITFYADIPMDDGMLHCRLTQKLREICSGWNEQRHSTSDYELHVIMQGAAEILFDDGTAVVLPQNHAMLIVPNIAHEAHQLQDNFERIFIHFSAEGKHLNQLLQAVPQHVAFPIHQEQVAYLSTQLLAELTGNKPFRRSVIESTLTLLVLKVLRCSGIEPAEPAQQPDDSALERKNIIEFHFRTDLAQHGRAEALAEKLGLSTRQLLRLLREYYGMSYQQMLIHTRMNQAMWLLQTTDQPIGQIAAAVGYSSEAAFRKIFQQHYGTTPKALRKRQTE